MRGGSYKTVREESDGVTLKQDYFGTFYYDDGSSVKIKRFTWKNRNRIQVQVINYGARIVSIKYPDRNGKIDDIVLGFDDLAGYIHYKQYYFGATIGRMSNVVIDSKFTIDGKKYFLMPNTKDGHHRNGGTEGFDQVIWKTWVTGKKVFMTHVSPHGDQGYPGHLLVQICFELCPINDFKIDMVAYTTQPTMVNLTNLLYLNLANHGAGPNSIYKHIVTVNCNCYTTQDEAGFSSGEIWNVVYTPLDVQAPVVLGKFMGLVPNDGFYQNMCLNRGVTQDEVFVARFRYPPSGRLIEIYSNQFGVQFDTANHFGQRFPPEEILLSKEIDFRNGFEYYDITMNIIDYLEKKMFEKLTEETESLYRNFKEYIRLLQKANYEHVTPASLTRKSRIEKDVLLIFEDKAQNFTCTDKELNYLKSWQTYLLDNTLDLDQGWLRQLIDRLILYAEANTKRKVTLLDIPVRRSHTSSIQSSKGTQFKGSVVGKITQFKDGEKGEVSGSKSMQFKENQSESTRNSVKEGEAAATKSAQIEDSETATRSSVKEGEAAATKSAQIKDGETADTRNTETSIKKRSVVIMADKLTDDKRQSVRNKSIDSRNSYDNESAKSTDSIKEIKEIKEKIVLLNKDIPLNIPRVPPRKNVIPSRYRTSDKIVGKGGAHYERHGGVAFQTQNYPNCANITSFPPCILRPGEKYRHTIKYKFWIRPGDPSKWVIKIDNDIAELKKNLQS